jgi:hypothetical protein
MTLIKDLIDLPEVVHKGDFVLKLTEGVERADETLDSYVVTPELVRNFDDALTFIRSAIESRSSKATYLDGSFGAGKSHFMAVLHLLLRGHARARAIPELAAVVAKHAEWLDGQRLLLVPYHMIGARSLESAILGHYVQHVRRLHPEAPVPGVYVAEALFEDAMAARRRMGDGPFFEVLNEGKERDSDWGELGQAWDAERFDAALRAAPGSEERSRLVGELVGTLFTSYAAAMQGQDEVYVPLDRGLSIISRHARDLGYQALILFLDELILWLASHAADSGFVRREIQKVAQLVEAQHGDRPVPIVSFVARQRDLRELVGEHVPGSEQLAFADMLKWWEGRLHKIGLLDRNLPAIAQKRVLKPRSETARAEIDRAFEETTKVRQEILETLLTSHADRGMFRQIYPFSPALVETLVAVSSVLQRERTAIKVMLQLLVSQRDTLKLGDVVPAGDLFDVIAEGDEAFSEGMRRHFDNAKRLYYQKLVPQLEAEHGIRLDEVRGLAWDDPKAVAFRIDDRLLKTLLLAALVPEVEPLKGLTARRLAALNHGSIRSPIPGQEGQMVLAKVRRWAAAVGEIKIGEEGANPTITLQLSGVDTESIIDKARIADNPGERRRRIREMLFKELEIEDRDELFLNHEFLWRNTHRSCDVVFANVRELPDESLRAKEDRWKIAIDFPFDEPGHGPSDDRARVQGYLDKNPASCTIVWIPSFFSLEAQSELGTLVILEHVLAGERINDYGSHLSAADRASARSLLDNRRSQLRERVKSYLEAAYGVAVAPKGAIGESIEPSDHVLSLDPTFTPQLPGGGNLGAAFENLLDQALSHQYPAHPHFEAEVRLPAVRKVFEEVQRAAADPQGRIAVDKSVRPLMRQIAVPLKLGEMGETHFVLANHWKGHFLRKSAQDGGPMTVEKLRAWIDDPEPRGLPAWIQNLLILIFAAQENYTFTLHGGPAGRVALDYLPNELVLRTLPLPAAEDWEAAVERVAPIFGIDAPKLRNAANVEKVAEEVRAQLAPARTSCEQLCRRLRERLRMLGAVPEDAARVQTADAVLALAEAVNAATSATGAIVAIANADLRTSAPAMGTSFKKAGAVAGGLEAINWEVFDAIGKLGDERASDAQAIQRDLVEVLKADEYARGLIPVLKRLQSQALTLLTKTEVEPASPPSGRPVRLSGDESGLALDGARDVFRELETALREDRLRRLDLKWKVTGGS